MLARIIDNQIIQLEQITPTEEDYIIKAFSVKHPRAQYVDMGIGVFDGWIRKYSIKTKRLAKPLLGLLRQTCAKYGLPLHIEDSRSPTRYKPNAAIIDPGMLSGVTLYDYQVRCLKAMCNVECGIIDAPTGAGKTIMMAAACKVFDCPTVIISEQLVVIDQIRSCLQLTKVAEEVGLFFAGKRPNGQQILVGSIQSLVAPTAIPKKTQDDTPESYQSKMSAYKTRTTNARVLRDLISKCHLLLVDEADTATSSSYRGLFKKWYRGRYKFGFTGTVDDPDKPVESLVLKEHLGTVVEKVGRHELEAVGRIVPVVYKMLAVGEDGNKKDRSAFDIAVKEWLIENKKFHETIKQICDIHMAKNEGMLVLVENIALGEELEKIIPYSKFICGNTGIKERRQVIQEFEKREIKVLIGGKILKRGFDLRNGCEAMIIATGGKLASDFKQKVGRALRVNAKKKSIVYDFLFLGSHYLYDHSRRRLKTISAMGYPSTVIFSDVSVDGDQFIKSRFRKPKPKVK